MLTRVCPSEVISPTTRLDRSWSGKLQDWVINRLWPRIEPWCLKGGYKPASFWTLRGLFFYSEAHQRRLAWQHDWILEQLKRRSWTTLLEVGCGFGRNLLFLREHFPANEKKLVGMDFSPTLLRKAQRLLAKKDIVLIPGDLLNPPALANGANVLLCHGVLMHTPPADIRTACSKMAHLSGGLILLVEQYTPAQSSSTASIPLNTFTFSHNYSEIFASLSFKETSSVVKNDLAAYVFEAI